MAQDEQTIAHILTESRTVAMIGLSMQPDRPSHHVAQYLQSQGYRVIPVNPRYAGQNILGERCFATLQQAARTVQDEGGRIDVVDCFRKSEEVAGAVNDAIEIGARYVWMQIGVTDPAAAARAADAGLKVVMDRCMKIEHMQLQQG